ncbi:MAG: cytochrome c oxidase subunit 3 [Candidatus Binatia bacterium]|nr:MAG: cytochrome c oxidase subunit 3 [Candidatus Binatia bacterium]
MAIGSAPLRSRPTSLGVPNSVLGMLLFLATEVMFFAGLISAFLVVKARWIGAWPPPGQPRLPVEMTALNTLVLLASGVVLWGAARAGEGSTRARSARTRSLIAAVLGALFVAVQGVEWARLLAFGLTMRSGPYGSFFYLIVGTHAAHAVAAILALLWVSFRLGSAELSADTFRAVRMFWYFVVGVWPVLYVLVYLM